MGIYAQTDFQIECKDEKSANAVLKKIQSLKPDENHNTFGQDLEVGGEYVYGKESSGRYQNLEYRMTELWGAIKDVPGVLTLEAPFMVESEGIYFSKAEE